MSHMVQPNLSTFDVIIIGAGINGAGIARDAAMRGLSVLLLDKGDIGGGTSSSSTRLIHGGLRYLEHREFGLVRESLRERECLLRIAPHLVRPLPLLIPVYETANRGLWTMRAGMFAYDVLSFDKKLPRHRMLSRAETLEQVPGLKPDGLLGAAVYYDAQVEFAERLVLENALSAVEHGATVISYAHVDKLIIEDQRVRGVEFTKFPGAPDDPGEQHHSARARVVINAAGPWVDRVLGPVQVFHQGARSSQRLIGGSRLIGGTKGSHIIVGPFAGAPASALYVEAETDHRPFFIIPWNSHYLIGTTDSRYSGDLDNVRIEDKEIDYLLGETNRVIPDADLTRKEILYTYSGVRPLPFFGGDVRNKDEPSITRRHFIRRHPLRDNLFSIVGGKLTSYRSLAEEAVNIIFKKLGRNSPACTTDWVPLPGAATPEFEAFCKDFKQHCGLSELTSDHLLRNYGTRSPEVLKLIADDPLLKKVFDAETGAIAAEVVFAFSHELAQTLSDCLLRRTMVGLNSTCGLKAVAAAGRIVQKHLGWSKDRVSRETAAYKNEISRRLARGSARLVRSAIGALARPSGRVSGPSSPP